MIQQLMMAANGHGHLPPQVHLPGNAGPMPPGAPMPGGPPPGAPPSGTSGQDKQIAMTAEQQLVHLAGAATDPDLKVVFSQALQALHKYLAADQKDQHQAMQGKLSPKVMGAAYGR